jgi:spoIIIJ-associated protein
MPPDQTTETPAARVRDLLERVVDAWGVEARVEIAEDDETIRGSLDGDDLGLAIGRHGQTIDALEHLAARLAYPGTQQGKRVVIDAAGYRARREEALERQAERAADEALKFGRPVALDAMVASERRFVHHHLRERTDIETYSEGDEPDRHLVVAPVVR